MSPYSLLASHVKKDELDPFFSWAYWQEGQQLYGTKESTCSTSISSSLLQVIIHHYHCLYDHNRCCTGRNMFRSPSQRFHLYLGC